MYLELGKIYGSLCCPEKYFWKWKQRIIRNRNTAENVGKRGEKAADMWQTVSDQIQMKLRIKP